MSPSFSLSPPWACESSSSSKITAKGTNQTDVSISVSTYWVPLNLYTAIWSCIYYFWTGLGITAGYHRLWAHRSYNASLPLRIWLAAMGAGAVEGSARWWSRG